MLPFDVVGTSIGIIGLGLNIILWLVPPEWRSEHRTIIGFGYPFGFFLFGLGFYMLLLRLIPIPWSESMLPKASMIVGLILLVGGGVAHFISTGSVMAQNLPGPSGSQLDHVTGLSIVGNGQGGPAAEIISGGGTQSAPSVGMDLNTVAKPGQSVTGVGVIQKGPGTGLRVIQTGPGVGLRSTATVGGDGANK